MRASGARRWAVAFGAAMVSVSAVVVLAAAAGGCVANERGPSGQPSDASGARGATGPLRVLVLSGGEHHDFDGNLHALLDGLEMPVETHWTFLPLDADGSDGVSRALRLAQLEVTSLPAEYDAILAYTQGELGLSPTAKEKLLAFVKEGGGFVGLHCAADSHPGWDEYVRMLGGRFESHPPFGEVSVHREAPARIHPVTEGLADRWELRDEFYHLQDLHLGDATVLMTGVSPEGGDDRPVTWVKPYGKGRVVYTILGHGPETHGDARFRRLVAQALVWVAGRN